MSRIIEVITISDSDSDDDVPHLLVTDEGEPMELPHKVIEELVDSIKVEQESPEKTDRKNLSANQTLSKAGAMGTAFMDMDSDSDSDSHSSSTDEESSAAFLQVEMVIPGPKVGLFIEKEMEVIKNIEAASGTKIHFAQNNILDQAADKLLLIVGDPNHIEKARQLVANKLVETSGIPTKAASKKRGIPQPAKPRGSRSLKSTLQNTPNVAKNSDQDLIPPVSRESISETGDRNRNRLISTHTKSCSETYSYKYKSNTEEENDADDGEDTEVEDESADPAYRPGDKVHPVLGRSKHSQRSKSRQLSIARNKKTGTIVTRSQSLVQVKAKVTRASSEMATEGDEKENRQSKHSKGKDTGALARNKRTNVKVPPATRQESSTSIEINSVAAQQSTSVSPPPKRKRVMTAKALELKASCSEAAGTKKSSGKKTRINRARVSNGTGTSTRGGLSAITRGGEKKSKSRKRNHHEQLHPEARQIGVNEGSNDQNGSGVESTRNTDLATPNSNQYPVAVNNECNQDAVVNDTPALINESMDIAVAQPQEPEIQQHDDSTALNSAASTGVLNLDCRTSTSTASLDRPASTNTACLDRQGSTSTFNVDCPASTSDPNLDPLATQSTSTAGIERRATETTIVNIHPELTTSKADEAFAVDHGASTIKMSESSGAVKVPVIPGTRIEIEDRVLAYWGVPANFDGMSLVEGHMSTQAKDNRSSPSSRSAVPNHESQGLEAGNPILERNGNISIEESDDEDDDSSDSDDSIPGPSNKLIHRIEIRNFMCIEKEDLDLDELVCFSANGKSAHIIAVLLGLGYDLVVNLPAEFSTLCGWPLRDLVQHGKDHASISIKISLHSFPSLKEKYGNELTLKRQFYRKSPISETPLEIRYTVGAITNTLPTGTSDLMSILENLGIHPSYYRLMVLDANNTRALMEDPTALYNIYHQAELIKMSENRNEVDKLKLSINRLQEDKEWRERMLKSLQFIPRDFEDHQNVPWFKECVAGNQQRCKNLVNNIAALEAELQECEYSYAVARDKLKRTSDVLCQQIQTKAQEFLQIHGYVGGIMVDRFSSKFGIWALPDTTSQSSYPNDMNEVEGIWTKLDRGSKWIVMMGLYLAFWDVTETCPIVAADAYSRAVMMSFKFPDSGLPCLMDYISKCTARGQQVVVSLKPELLQAGN